MRSPSAVVPRNVSRPAGTAPPISTRDASGARATISGACPGRCTATASGRSAPLTMSRRGVQCSMVHAVTLPSPAKLTR